MQPLRPERSIQEGGELTRNRACPPGPSGEEPFAKGMADRYPVHTVVTQEPAVLRSDHRLPERGGDVRKAGPIESSACRVDPELVEDFPIPVQKDRPRRTGGLPV